MVTALFSIAGVFFFGSFLVQGYAPTGGDQLARFLRFLCVVSLLLGTWFAI